MQAQHHEAAHLAALGREWIAAWNSHDLERVLALPCANASRLSQAMTTQDDGCR
jgi:ketosteroid isomerase-like protein